MSFIDNLLSKFYPPLETITPGTYHYQSPPEADSSLRMHLRVHPDGTGLLILNASTVLHLNQTATEYAYHIIRQTPTADAVSQVSKRYRVDRSQVEQDLREFRERLDVLIETTDLDPETILDFERHEPYSGSQTAPYRLDCALTYRSLDSDMENSAPLERVSRELSTQEWQAILQTAWDAGVPHTIFTGGEPTLRDDLIALIRYGETLGQVTGLITNGYRLSDHDYLVSLLQSGLDHIMFVLDPVDYRSWLALEAVMAEDIFTAVHLTLNDDIDDLDALLNRLNGLNVTHISLSVSQLAHKERLEAAREAAAAHGLTLVWDLPVPYSRHNPVQLELAGSGEVVQGAGKAWLYIEPDGDVLAGQGIQPVLGNLLTDGWESVWQKATSRPVNG